jgi:uncharacterized membrane protein
MFSFFKKRKDFFTPEENKIILDAIREAEMRTSGEIRVFIENRCRFVDPLDRAIEIFANLKMYNTHHRNAVLLYIALKDHQLAVFGDEGIHQRVGSKFWQDEVRMIISKFKHKEYAQGIADCVRDIGESLHEHFPYVASEDKNELPDEIIFGK